jgi:serine/threonine-protein kinase
MAADAHREMLCGLLTLQNGLIDPGQLVAAFQTWSRDRSRTLAEHLRDRGDLDADDMTLVEALVERHLRKHGHDSCRSLAAVQADRSMRERLASIAGLEIDGSLTTIAAGASDVDADGSTVGAVGAPTSGGGRFRILRPLARGGLGAVYAALDRELNREVALKEILDRHADDPASRQRFQLEAEVTGRLEHPGIVPVHGLGAYQDGRPYYAMRLIQGDTLKAAIDGFHADATTQKDAVRRSLELRKLLRRFVDVCNTIDYAHSRGVLHRDIKPSNIIVGKYGETLVIDWGLAKAIGRAESGSAPDEPTLVPSSSDSLADTLPGSALGTPAYMSPEQAAGDHACLGPRADVYSLGATLYCILTGKPPFAGADVGKVLEQVRRGGFPRPHMLNPRVDRALEAICLKAMAAEPERRYATPRELADDVERWAADEPVSAFIDPPWGRFGRWSRKHRVASTAFVVLLSVLVPGLLAANSLLNREKRRTEENFRQTRAAIRSFVALAYERPGARTVEGLRRRIGSSAQDYYAGFLREHMGDPSLEAELAWSHLVVASYIAEDFMERARQQGVGASPRAAPQAPPPPDPTPPRADATPRAVAALPVVPAPPPPTSTESAASLDEAIQHNEMALSLYEGLIERHHAPKGRELQLCYKQRELLADLRQASATRKPLYAPGSMFAFLSDAASTTGFQSRLTPQMIGD